jgi:ornithine cyclodeaminase/alanine dehydrogenase-like protein (mu-crystallin family)
MTHPGPSQALSQAIASAGTSRHPALDVLYLNDADITALAIAPGDVTAAVRAAFAAAASGEAVTGHQLEVVVDANLDFKAKGAVLKAQGLAAVKWFGFAGENDQRGLPHFIPVILLNALPTGVPVAIMDGHWISGVRTAAISAVAAGVLARPDAASVGFIAGGLQAEAHLAALRAQFPIERIAVYSRRGESAQRLAGHARAAGIEALVCADPRDAVRGRDIVVTSVPRMTEHAHFLDVGWTDPGTFVSMVDAGRSWQKATLAGFGLMLTDYRDPTTRRSTEKLNFDGTFEVDLCSLVGGGNKPALTRDARRGLIFGGSGLADAAVAALVYARAQAAGVGQRLAL